MTIICPLFTARPYDTFPRLSPHSSPFPLRLFPSLPVPRLFSLALLSLFLPLSFLSLSLSLSSSYLSLLSSSLLLPLSSSLFSPFSLPLFVLTCLLFTVPSSFPSPSSSPFPFLYHSLTSFYLSLLSFSDPFSSIVFFIFFVSQTLHLDRRHEWPIVQICQFSFF